MTVFENPYLEKKSLDPMFSVGRKVRIVQAKVSLSSSSANGDVVILAKGLPATARIHRIMLPKGVVALTDAVISIGFYAHETHKVLDADAIVKSRSFTDAQANIDLVGEGISDFDVTKDIVTLLELNPGEAPSGGFDLCATIEAKGSVVGTIDMDIYIEQD